MELEEFEKLRSVMKRQTVKFPQVQFKTIPVIGKFSLKFTSDIVLFRTLW